MVKDVILKVAIKAVVVHGDKVLIMEEAIRERGNQPLKYGLPGGKIEPHEKFEEGFLREMEEETGVRDYEIGDPIHIGEWFPEVEGKIHHIVAIFVVCTTSTPNITLSEEHTQYRWIEASEYDEYDFMTPDGYVVKKYFNSKQGS